MLFGTSIRVLLWMLLVVVLGAVAAYLAIDLGLVDWAFNLATKTRLDDWKERISEKYGLNRDSIDTSLKIAGLASTIIYGAVTLLKAWHFAKINLPLRLQEIANRIKETQIRLRPVLLAPYASRNLRGDRTPAPKPRFLDTLSSLFWATPSQKAAQRLMSSVNTLDGDIRALRSGLEICKPERITAHLLTALKLEAEARLLSQGSTQQSSKYADAHAEVRAALELDENDLDALEQAAKLAKSLNTKGPLQKALEDFERAAQKEPTRYARALRFQAEVLEERATKAALNGARIKLETALEALDDPNAGDEKPFELALVNEQLAALHLKRGTPTLVEEYLDQAAQNFETLSPPEGPAGLERIKQLRERLAQALRGGDEPEEPEEKEEAQALTQPTHVNSEQLQVFKEMSRTGDLGPKLEPFTGVILLSEHQDWARIAKDGETLGYVDRARLHRLS